MAHSDATFYPCGTFGGGWVVPLTDEGYDWLEAFFNDAPAETPINETAWIVEPQDVRDLAESAAGQIIIELGETRL